MWADTLLHWETQAALRLLLWSTLSVAAGGTLLVAVRRKPLRLLRHFAIQTAVCGFAEACIAAAWWRTLHLRDARGAAQLSSMLSLVAAIVIGVALAAVVLGAQSWPARRLPVIGAAVGVVVQVLAVLALDLQLLAKLG
jgi:hypothetical protein